MEDGDALIFMNFRADRAREITRAFVNADFDGLPVEVVNLDFVMLTGTPRTLKSPVLIRRHLWWRHSRRMDGENDKTQLRISETENARSRQWLLLQRRR